jgi:hypothetical protein
MLAVRGGSCHGEEHKMMATNSSGIFTFVAIMVYIFGKKKFTVYL